MYYTYKRIKLLKTQFKALQAYIQYIHVVTIALVLYLISYIKQIKSPIRKFFKKTLKKYIDMIQNTVYLIDVDGRKT